ncbi:MULTISPECIES: sigma-70 family RNA polymerase sigma factor [Paraburkholderia]|uniref:sigma-70 family RNA polymerase sigma factor n=1 Tax=Paraburkholderia TaxID=1822464 RepID=UPI0022549EB0|nr:MULTISPECIES: sigma-70 family RNA polymerase sigma factor [Paraburkholderia]MCX4177499.1 sigma-70 family RNA polymerase sigma factor [Paraburkholderia madseniana]MDQ6465488.1 sigma-70 family RNA polymerase sigma factor [Paraburkholderia madseniana]
MGRLFKIAVSAGIESAVRLHIARGADLECRDEKGFTPLMVAASRDWSGVCHLLLSAGADVLAVDSAGRNALTIARECGATTAVATISAYLDRFASFDLSSMPLVENGRGSAGLTSDSRIADKVCIERPGSNIQIPRASLGRLHESTDNYKAPQTAVSETVRDRGTADDGRFQRLRAENGSIALGSVSTSSAEHEDGTASPCSSNVNDKNDKHMSASYGVAVSATPDGKHEPVIELTFGDWVEVDVSEPPAANMVVVHAETERQRRIDDYTPIDLSEAWDEIDAYLPESATPLPRLDDQGFRDALRRLLLRALREGSIPRVAIENGLSIRGDGEDRNLRAEAALEFVIGDIGADIDERIEFSSAIPSENFEVFVDAEETESEELEIRGAIQHFEETSADKNSPLQLYQRAAVKRPLLSADQEIQLAQQMEDAIARALDALTCWPVGMRRLLEEIDKTAGSTSSLSTIIVLSSGEAGDSDMSIEFDEDPSGGPALDVDAGEDFAASASLSEDESARIADDPIGVVSAIQALAVQPMTEATTSAIRDQLGRLRFRRPFLIALDEVAKDDQHHAATAYRQAIASLIVHRNRMAHANLRLAMDLAWRRVHAGLSIEDLIQEGNLGLLKAVDRFDWRRGFRFSTMATWWIRQQIDRAIGDTALAIRLPVHVHEKVSRERRDIDALERARGEPLSLAERARLCNMPYDKFELVARALSEPLSIDELQQTGFFDFQEVDESFATLARREEADLINALLAKLTRKEAEVLRLRFGIDIPEARTLEEIGAMFDVTRERVRQIEAKALRRLSTTTNLELLANASGRVSRMQTKSAGERAPSCTADTDQWADATVSYEVASQPDLVSHTDPSGQTDALPKAVATAAAKGISMAMQKLLDQAQELGVDVSEDPTDSGARFIFGSIDPQTAKARKFVRDLIKMGFTLQPDIGYRQ